MVEKCLASMGTVPKRCCGDCKDKDCDERAECFDRSPCSLDSTDGCVWLVSNPVLV